MKCEFWMTGDFGVFNFVEQEIARFTKMDDAVDFIQENWVEGDGQTADVVDMTTGEILLHFEDEGEPVEWDDDYDETGYNPYMGCYDWDC